MSSKPQSFNQEKNEEVESASISSEEEDQKETNSNNNKKDLNFKKCKFQSAQ